MRGIPIVAYASPKLMGFCECVEGHTCEKLIPLLEGIYIENIFSSNVYDLPLVDHNLESKKRMREVSLEFI